MSEQLLNKCLMNKLICMCVGGVATHGRGCRLRRGTPEAASSVDTSFVGASVASARVDAPHPTPRVAVANHTVQQVRLCTCVCVCRCGP